MNKRLLYCVCVALSSTLFIRNMFDGCVFCEFFKYIMQLYFIKFRWSSAHKSPFLTTWKRKMNNPCGETKLRNVRCEKSSILARALTFFITGRSDPPVHKCSAPVPCQTGELFLAKMTIFFNRDKQFGQE